MTRSGAITSCNPAATQMYGWSACDIIGHVAEEFIPQRCRSGDLAALRRIVAGEEVQQYRTERISHDGTVMKVSVSMSPILDSAGEIVGVATTSRRITDLQQAHDRFELRVDQHRTDVVDAAGRLEERADQQRADLQDASDRFEAQVDVERQVASDAAERSEALVDLQRQEAADASDRFEAQVDLERVEVREAQNRSDIELDAGRAQAESDKEYLQAQLHQSQRLEVLGQLAGGVAHDFNNLLAVILNYAAFVSEELAAGHDGDLTAATGDVGQIQRAAERATALTHQLLAFARREVVQPVVVDLNEVVAEVTQLLDRTIGEDIVLSTNLTGGLWPVLADVGQLEQVLVNLAVNARDAMGDGGTLTIDTANVTVGAGRQVRLRVADTGAGMAPDVIEHVFEPFYTTKADGAGTGLGLATVYGIVLQAEATIDIHSLLGVGTTFTILLPVTDEVATPVEEEPTYERTTTGETVLIVEDEEALRQVTERIFTRSGYRVITATDGADALALANRHEGDIHLLVTDVVMPNMLGKEVAERIRLLRPDIQVLYMSGYAQPVLAAQGRLDRDVNLIEKPFTAAALTAKAGQILQRPR
ncbi:PAS domain-containing sensor histidine kinase [Pilimelia columellifera subsp. columellifera]|uniref:histidine kinase n=2 Tax=Pilimelia TaxID=53370 RepID=A0ABP6ACR0_9ACTN